MSRRARHAAPRSRRSAPEHGIKVQKIGATWWGQRWIRGLEAMSLGYSSRLVRGRSYARAGRVHDLTVAAGRVQARVTGSRPRPYEVTIELATFAPAAWTAAIQAMAARALFAADLLAGQMPEEIDEVFHAGDASLFPSDEDDLSTSCTCPDWASPCKHVAATHYVLGESLDHDPFLLFELRGRSREQVLAELRVARGGAPGGRGARRKAAGIPSVKLGALSAVDYDRPRAALPELRLTFEAPAVPGALLRQLGTPRSWPSESAPADLLAPLVRAAAEHACKLALAEPEPEAPARPAATKRS